MIVRWCATRVFNVVCYRGAAGPVAIDAHRLAATAKACRPATPSQHQPSVRNPCEDAACAEDTILTDAHVYAVSYTVGGADRLRPFLWTRDCPLGQRACRALNKARRAVDGHARHPTGDPEACRTWFCIRVAMSSVTSAVEPPAPQVMSQKTGACATMRSKRSNRFSTPCLRHMPGCKSLEDGK